MRFWQSLFQSYFGIFIGLCGNHMVLRSQEHVAAAMQNVELIPISLPHPHPQPTGTQFYSINFSAPATLGEPMFVLEQGHETNCLLVAGFVTKLLQSDRQHKMLC